MPHLYSVKKSGDRVVVESQNANAKQLFFAWGSDRSAVDGSFYGREVRGAWGPNRELRWRWVLTPEAVGVMLRNLDREHYRDAEDRPLLPAVRELERKLRATLGTARRATSPHGRCRPQDDPPHCAEHAADPSVASCAPARRARGRRSAS